MRIIEPSYEIIETLSYQQMLDIVEGSYRICYASEPKGNAEEFISSKMKLGHHSPLEHCTISVDFVNDRGISHEQVRHRLASFAQMSTRYCNYSKDKFGNEITVINPLFFDPSENPTKEMNLPVPMYNGKNWELGNMTNISIVNKFDVWFIACLYAEWAYMSLLDLGATPQEARSVLSNSLATKIRITANIREWRLIFQQRALGTTGKPHPSMVQVMLPLLVECKKRYPVFFADLNVTE